MVQVSRWQIVGAAAIAGTLSLGVLAQLTSPHSHSAVASPEQGAAFPDTADHWAQSFIQPLTEQNIIAGYPDGTFRPEEAVARDEFAAILRQAFNRDQQRQIADGSVYQDVPADHWAAPAIEEAYEMGYMEGYPEGVFLPDQAVTRTEALVSLAQNLDPDVLGGAETPAETEAPTAAAATTTEQPTAQQPATAARQPQRLGMMPMALTSLMQPFITPTRQRTNRTNGAQAAARTAETQQAAPTAAAGSQAAPPPVSVIVSEQFVDADQIPPYAINDVAKATEAGIVVNYPEPQVLNPNRPATRGEIAAFIHQALVRQGAMAPIVEGEASNFIVNRTATEGAISGQ
jgi:hypothetical protein